jgi:hypothetical protein
VAVDYDERGRAASGIRAAMSFPTGREKETAAMKIRWSTTLVSALLLSLCLFGYIPGSLRLALNWQDLRFSCVVVQNFSMSMGLYGIGFVMIGLITLWTGYRKRELSAWFVMFIILLFFSFSGGVFPWITRWITQFHTLTEWARWFAGVPWNALLSKGPALGIINFVVMLIALLLPIKAFFGTRYDLNESN